MEMNFRHAAALALVGWYLMVPYDGTSPNFGGWTIRATFEKRTDCESAAAKLRADGYGSSAVDRIGPSDSKDEDRASQIWQEENAKCLASHDPHPKAKKATRPLKTGHSRAD